MIVGSIKENLSLEKRVSITPETAKNIINLGLKVIIENDYATHIGISDNEYKKVGVEIKKSSKEVLDSCNLLTKVICPTDNEIANLRDKTILIPMHPECVDFCYNLRSKLTNLDCVNVT